MRPDSASAYYQLGLALELKGDQEAALDELQIAYSLDPDNPAIRTDYEKLSQEMKAEPEEKAKETSPQ